MSDRYTLHAGDCREVMRDYPADHFDSIVSDPPYGLSFMGNGWDKGVPGEEFWREALRVAKPGAYLLAFGGTRTFHRLTVAIEDAGWEIRDVVCWLYGSGFPKSLDVSKAIDRAAGAEREVVGPNPLAKKQTGQVNTVALSGDRSPNLVITAPATADAQQWSGWGTALKPAWEPVIMARKPLVGTVAANLLLHGTGALNIDGARVGAEPTVRRNTAEMGYHGGNLAASYATGSPQGRWPANVMHDGSDEVVAGFPQSEASVGTYRREQRQDHGGVDFGVHRPAGHTVGFGDSGSAARFFYCAKASRTDREEGCDHLPARTGAEAVERDDDTAGLQSPRAGAGRTADTVRNFHPTVKPTDLMRYLCRLVTPTDGLVLDPFMGSGSTGKGALLEGFRFVGIDLDPAHVAIAEARCQFAVETVESECAQLTLF